MDSLKFAAELDHIFGEQSDTDLLETEARIAAELERRRSENRLSTYRPYLKQREFHAAGAHHRERILIAANQVGKTWGAGYELAMHVTGIYPPDWEGRRFDRPTRWIVGSESTELMRKGVQRILLGPPEDQRRWGTGSIPKAHLIDTPRKAGVPDAVASISVKHISGGTSSIQMASYDQGRTKWQADTLDGAWLDEEPPLDLYTEALTRTNAVEGPIMLTFTPMMGQTEVVKRYLVERVAGSHVTTMTLEDAEHYTPEQRDRIRATYPAHERDARTMGTPMRGSGAVFPLSIGEILCDSFEIPSDWPQLCGIDFGWQHPSAGVRIAWNRDADVIYVIAEHRAKEQTPLMFAGAVRPWGEWLPWAWPADGHASGGKFGAQDQLQLSQIYRSQGMKMLPQHATFPDGSNGVEAGIMEMLGRMETGRLKIFRHLNLWQEEFGLYIRKDGLLVKENDDLISATRYAIMMRRCAIVRYKKVIPPEMDRLRVQGRESWMAY